MVFLTQMMINDPLSSRVPSDESIGQPRGIRGLSERLCAESRFAESEGKKRGLYNK